MDSSVDIMKNILSGCSLRHRVLANNLANAETPNFRRHDVNFKQTLTAAINEGDRGRPVNFEIQRDDKSPSAPNGNNVCMQRELGLVLQNNLLYNTTVSALSKKFSMLRQSTRTP